MIQAKVADKERTTIIDCNREILIHKFLLRYPHAIFHAKVGLHRHFGVVVEFAHGR